MSDINHFTNDQLILELQKRLNQDIELRNAEECVRLQEEVRFLSARLKESEGGKSQFLSNVRNEINNPLTSILGLAASIGEVDASERVKRMGKLIFQQAFNLNFQMRNIIVAAEIELGEIQPMSSNVDIVTLIQDQLSFLMSKLEEVNVGVKVQLPAQLKFRTDPYLLQTICVNLFSNAIEYSGRNKFFIVESFEQEGLLVIEVKDFGVGISIEKQKFVFERFQQIESGVTKSHPGHGLGLTISRELVELLGGTLDLNSFEGQGTTVKIQIPPLILDLNPLSTSSFGNELLFTDGEEF